jgi:hypothetical protein
MAHRKKPHMKMSDKVEVEIKKEMPVMKKKGKDKKKK